MIDISSAFFLSQVFKLEGDTDCYLFVKPDMVTRPPWLIRSDLDGKERCMYIQSTSAGLSPGLKCAARCNRSDWSFNKAGEDEEEDWEEGGIVVHCTVHDQSSAR